MKTHTKSIVIKKESEYYFDLGALRYNVYGCIFVSIRRLIHVKIYNLLDESVVEWLSRA